MTKKNFDNLILDSSFEEIERLGAYLESIQRWANFSDDEFARIELAANEAVTNAMVHGNKQDAAKKVRVSASIHENMLQITVQDEGPGFDPSSLPDPLEEENILKESGRGVFLIKQYTDDVEFLEKGTKLKMHFGLGD